MWRVVYAPLVLIVLALALAYALGYLGYRLSDWLCRQWERGSAFAARIWQDALDGIADPRGRR